MLQLASAETDTQPKAYTAFGNYKHLHFGIHLHILFCLVKLNMTKQL